MDAFVRVVENNPLVLAALPLLGYVSAIVTQKSKKWFHVQKDFTKILINIGISALGAVLLYLSQDVKEFPTVLAPYGSIIATFATLAYHLPGLGVKSLAQQLNEGKAEIARKERMAAADTAVSQVDPQPLSLEPTGEFGE